MMGVSCTREAALRVSNLQVHYALKRNIFSRNAPHELKAVDGVSLELFPGEALGIVGESGCGKSSLGRAIVRLVEPIRGNVELLGRDFTALKGKELKTARSKIQLIFQDPYSSLDPRMTVLEILAEPLRAHQRLNKSELNAKIRQVLQRVGISPKACLRYPHEFSGGQKQRIAIARALMLEPQVIIADEPVSSLDVSVQAQILNLLKTIQMELKLSLIFISHNLAVVNYIADRVAVMYLGKFVEIGTKQEIFKNPKHPYTQALLSAVPIPDPGIQKHRTRTLLRGEPPSPLKPPSGCAFHPRCPIATAACRVNVPQLEPLGSQSRWVSCFEAK